MSGMVDIIFEPEADTKNKVRFQELDGKGKPAERDAAYCEKLYISKAALQRMKWKDGQKLHVSITLDAA